MSARAPLIAVLVAASAAAAPSLTIQDAVDAAMQHHPSMVQRRVQLVEVAGLLSATRRAWLPVPTASASYGWNLVPVSGPLYSYFQPYDRAMGTNLVGSVSLAGQVPVTSTRYSLGLNLTRVTTDRLDSLLGTTMQLIPTLELRQPLLRNGLGRPYAYELETRERTMDIAQLRLGLQAQQIVLSVVEAFLEAYRAQLLLEVRRNATESAEQSLKIAQALLTGGRSIAENVDTARAELTRRQRDFIEAKLFHQRAITSLLAACYLDSAPGWQGTLPELRFEPPQIDAPPPEDELAREVLAHPTIKEIEIAVAVAKANLALAQNAVLPDLSLTGRIGLLGQGGDANCFGGVTRNGSPCGVNPLVGQGSFSGTAASLAAGAYPLWEVGGQFSVPLADTTAWSSLATSEAQLREAQASLDGQRVRFAWEARTRLREWTLATERLEAATRATELAEKTWGAVTKRFQMGGATAFDQLRSLEQLFLARESLNSAQLDLARAAFRLEEIRPGLLLKRFVKEGPRP